MNRVLEYIYDMRREAAKRELEQRKKSIYERYPQIDEIDRMIAQEHIQIGKAKVMGLDPAPMKENLERLRRQRREQLEQLNLTEEEFKIHYFCPRCRDTGYVQDRQGRYVPCVCLKELLTKDSYKNSNMNKRLQKENFEHFRPELFDDAVKISMIDGRILTQRQAILWIKEEMENFVQEIGRSDRSLVFWGGTGLGKSYMSSCIAKRAIEQYKTVIYFSIRELIQCLETYTFRREEFEKSYGFETRRLIFESDLLIIDDLGSEIKNHFVETELFHIVNMRTEQGKQMLISTNKNPLELRELYGERTYSRIVKYFDFYPFIGSDIRRK